MGIQDYQRGQKCYVHKSVSILIKNKHPKGEGWQRGKGRSSLGCRQNEGMRWPSVQLWKEIEKRNKRIKE